jgi:hypothetical protein
VSQQRRIDAGRPALVLAKRRLWCWQKGGYAVSEVAKEFRQRRFFDLSDRDKRDILKLTPFDQGWEQACNVAAEGNGGLMRRRQAH